jgi:hypothetical protein
LPTRTANTSNHAFDRSECWWGTLAEPPSLPLLRLEVDRIRREVKRRLDRLEDDIVELVVEAFLLWEPFDLVDAVRMRSSNPNGTSVIVNAIVAASHTTRPLARGRRQIEFLAAACPDVLAGIGWLGRLDHRSGTLTGMLTAAVDVYRALVDIDESGERAAWAAA